MMIATGYTPKLVTQAQGEEEGDSRACDSFFSLRLKARKASLMKEQKRLEGVRETDLPLHTSNLVSVFDSLGCFSRSAPECDLCWRLSIVYVSRCIVEIRCARTRERGIERERGHS